MGTATLPSLTSHEWRRVQAAMRAAFPFDCRDRPRDGAFARLLALLPGTRRDNRAVPMHLRPVQALVCATSHRRTPDNEVIAALAAQGFSSAEIAAIAILSA